MEIKDSKPLLELALKSFFCRAYCYSPPSLTEIDEALKKAGISHPRLVMEQWRKEEGVYTDRELGELAEKGEE